MSTRAWIAFASVSVLWGIPYLFIKVAVDDGMPPAFLAWVRVLLGAAVLLALAWRAGVLGSVLGKMRWVWPPWCSRRSPCSTCPPAPHRGRR